MDKFDTVSGGRGMQDRRADKAQGGTTADAVKCADKGKSLTCSFNRGATTTAPVGYYAGIGNHKCFS